MAPHYKAQPLITMTASRVKLSDIDRDHLVNAVESATKIQRKEDFRTWICSEFRALLPHDGMVCVEIDEHGSSHLVECLQHGILDATPPDCDGFYDLSLRILRSLPRDSPISQMIEDGMMNAWWQVEGDERPDFAANVQNALIHRIEFISGARYHLFLFNIPREQAQRSPHLFKLLSSHVKMALSWRVSQHETRKRPALTPRELEILAWMKEGKSNREISALLGINPITLKTHVAKIYRKLDVQTRNEAVSQGLSPIGSVLSGEHRAKTPPTVDQRTIHDVPGAEQG